MGRSELRVREDDEGGDVPRLIFDYRVFAWVTVEAYLFEARYGGGVIEFQVNPEFESEEAAREQVDTYAPAPDGCRQYCCRGPGAYT